MPDHPASLWKLTKLGELADVVGGVTLGRSLSGVGTVELPYLRVANVQDGYIDTFDMKCVRVLRDEVSRYQLEEGDFLMTEGGDFDKLGRGAIWDGSVKPCLHQNHIFRVRTDRSRLLPQFLAAYANSHAGRAYFLAASKRTTNLASINLTQVRAFPVPVPSLYEQRQVVGILDSADESVRSTECLITKLTQVRNGLLSDLFTYGVDEDGRIRHSPSWRHDFVDTELGSRPRSWQTLPLGQVCRIRSGGTPSRSVVGFWRDGTVPWVKTAEVSFSVIDDTEERITASAVVATGLQVHPPGTVLVAMYGQGMTRGRAGILGIPATTNQACAALWCEPQLMKQEFLYHQLSHSYDRLRRLGHGSNQTNLSAELLGKMTVIVPSLDEQHRILEYLNGYDIRIKVESEALQKRRVLRRGMMDDLLTGRVRVKAGEDVSV